MHVLKKALQLLHLLLLSRARAAPEWCQAQERGHAQLNLFYLSSLKVGASAAKAQRQALSKRHSLGDEEFPREEHS